MKRPLLPFTLLLLVLSNCQHEDEILSHNKIQFSLDAVDAADLPNEIAVDISLVSTGSSMVKTLIFQKVENRYLSLPIDLPIGNYKITTLTADETLVNVAAQLRQFSVAKNQATQVVIGHAAKAHGAKPLLVSVYIDDNGEKTLTDAKATITSDEGEVYEYYLAAKNNNIKFPGNPESSYTIDIEKEGYETYNNTFVYNQLVKKRLDVTLTQRVVEPGLALTFEPSATVFTMWLELKGKGTITLDWGQGDIEVMDFDVDPDNETATAFRYREQTYATSTPAARITGDIHLIRGINFESAVNGLDAEYATGLERVSFQDGEIPKLDLKNNSELKALSFVNTYVGEMTLPPQHAINNLYIQPITDWTFWPTESQLDYIIDNLHTNAVAGGIRNGLIDVGTSPVSATSAAMLEELQDSYGWGIIYY